MIVCRRIVRLAASVGLICVLGLASSVTEGLAQRSGGFRKGPVARDGGSIGRSLSSRPGRFAVPRSSRAAATPRVARSLQRSRPSRRAATTSRSRIVMPRRIGRSATRIARSRAAQSTRLRRAPALRQRAARHALRKAPKNLALINRGLRHNPGQSKPAHVQHDPKRKAGKSGWAHRHRPF